MRRADLQGNMRTARNNYARAELPLHVIQRQYVGVKKKRKLLAFGDPTQFHC
jgi:hypothetical protein